MKRGLINIFLSTCVCLIISGTLYPQNSVATLSAKTANDGNADTKVDGRANIKEPKIPGTTEQQLAALAEKMAKLESIIEAQQKKIDELQAQQKARIGGSQAPAATGPFSGTGRANTGSVTANDPTGRTDDSPLTLKLGPNTSVTPVGTVDFTAVWRSKNTGNSFGTGFGAIPFINTVGGNLTEIRLGAMNSRFGLRFDAKLKDSRVIGFFETDFSGNDPSNVMVSANAHTNRLRHFWVDYRKGKIELVGGQSWSLLTPNRDGIGPLNDNVFTTLNNDQVFQAGLVWARQGGFRFIYHANKNVQVGFAVENPQQFVGAGEVIFPFAFNAALGTQFDAANNPGTPNVIPDIIGKVAYDSRGGRRFHIEAAGFMRAFRNTYVPLGGTTFSYNTVVGYGGSVNANLEVAKGFRIIANTFFSRGGGRYIGGLGPDLVIRPIATSATTFSNNISLVDSYSTVDGFEARVNDKLTVDGYYGGAYFGRNAFEDVTSPLAIKPFIGFGGTNSPNSANRAIQEVTGGLTYTFWQDPKYGAMKWVTQISYVTRSPWFVATGAPIRADGYMVFTSMRYVLPGKAPDVEK